MKRHSTDTPRADFVPIERIGASVPAPIDDAVFDSLAAHLEHFSAGLDEREASALAVLLDVAGTQSPLELLASQPAHAVLDGAELDTFNAILLEGSQEPLREPHGPRPTLTVVMKATRLCNLRCTYCHFWADGPNQLMSFEVLARATRDALEIHSARSVEFVWHGGETTLLPIAYYRKALWLQQQFRKTGQKVSNAIQTNGTRFTDEWLAFCSDFGVSVGVSLDGPPEVHDRRRVDAAGRPSSGLARATLENLRRLGLEHGVLMVVDAEVIQLGARRLLDYFLEIGVKDVGLLNVIPENAEDGTGRGSYVPWADFVGFLRELFRLWWPNHADRIAFREISDLFDKLRGKRGTTCFFAGDCMGSFLTVEPNGDVSACDKYIGDPDYRFGSLLKGRLTDLLAGAPLTAIRTATVGVVEATRSCPWFHICQGACPHDRYLRARRGVPHDESCCGLAPLLADMAAALPQPWKPTDLRPAAAEQSERN
jgi:uncharacterized protein